MGQQVYFTANNNIVWAIDASQPAQPKVIGSIDLPGWYGRIIAAENTLYVSASGAGLYVLTTTP